MSLVCDKGKKGGKKYIRVRAETNPSGFLVLPSLNI